MSDSKLAAWIKSLLRPSPSKSVLSLVVVGLVLGVTAMVGFDTVMHATSTDTFCTSCHEMEIPSAQWQKTSHYSNATGINAGCSDCHVPKEFIPKMIRKIEASREVWGSITGIIDTPEKYAAHAPHMKQREIARLQANNSQECRNCHTADRMMSALQSVKAQEYHALERSQGKTCIDCHAGIAHPENSESVASRTD